MDPFCRGCVYRGRLQSSSTISVCNYCLLTSKLRGCPAGEGCTRKDGKLPKGIRKAERVGRAVTRRGFWRTKSTETGKI